MNASLSATSGRVPTGESFTSEDENLTIWSDNETALFLSIWRRPDVQTALRQYTRKRPIWKKVSLELANEGYRRNAEQCKSKMHNLMTSYRRVKKGLDSEARCKFFPLIDEVMTSVEFERPSPTSAAGSAGASLSLLSSQSSAASPAPGAGRQLVPVSEDTGAAAGNRGQRISVGYRDERPDEAALVCNGPSPGSSTHSEGSSGTRGSPHPLSVVPWRMGASHGAHVEGRHETSSAATAAAVIAHVQRSWNNDDVCPPAKRFCNWESSESVYAADGDPVERSVDRCSSSSDSHQAAAASALSSFEPRDLRVTERLSPLPVATAAPIPQSRSPPPATVMSTGMYAIEAHRLLAERARHLFGVVPQTPLPAGAVESGANGWHDTTPAGSNTLPDGGTMRHRLNSSGPSLSSTGNDHSVSSSLARMEGFLQELLDLQRAFILSEERRRREYMEREEILQEQNREFLLQLVHSLNNSN